MATIPSGFPSSANTGVPDGVQLKVYTGPMTITKDGTVIDGMIINGSLRITASNVVIKNSQINFSGVWGIDADYAKNFTIMDSTIVGPGKNGDTTSAILGSGTFLRNDISKSENGIQLVRGSSVVKGNYIHDLEDGGRDPHYDGISVQGEQNNVVIEGNTIIGRDTSDIFIKNDFGPINNVVVKGNYLIGDPGYMIYVDGRASGGPITNVTISGNYLEKGFYGYYSVDNSSPVITGNVQLAEGQLPSVAAPAAPITPITPVTPTTPIVSPEPATPSTPSKIPGANAPSNPGDSDGGSSAGGHGAQANVSKVNVSPGNVGVSGNHSAAGGLAAEVVKVGGHSTVNVSTSSVGHSNVSAADHIGVAGVGGHSAFQFSGLSNASSSLDRVADFGSHSSMGQVSKAALLSSYASSLADSGDAAFGIGGHSADNGNMSLKLNVLHDGFHIL